MNTPILPPNTSLDYDKDILPLFIGCNYLLLLFLSRYTKHLFSSFAFTLLCRTLITPHTLAKVLPCLVPSSSALEIPLLSYYLCEKTPLLCTPICYAILPEGIY